MSSSQTIGFEALLRWQHPRLGPISPAVFIPLLEDLGHIVTVGEWVLNQACAQLRQWQTNHDPDLRMAVNVSARQFDDPDITAKVERALAATGLEPEFLELEVTEGLIMRDVEGVSRTLRRLGELGVRVAIDDFGTGYSQLVYLAKFPIDVLKVDRSVIETIGQPEGDRLVAAVIRMGQTLGLEVVAEGVEEESQLAFLHEHGCDLAQGYLMSRPMSVADGEKWLAARAPVRFATAEPLEGTLVVMSERNGVTPFEQTGLAATLTAQTSRAGSGDGAEAPAPPMGSARYDLGEEIGRGGMGLVYSANDRQFSREVAIKRLRPDARDAGHYDRFVTECLITGNLEHPGIPAVYERGGLEDGGEPFCAMRRVRGRTLEEALGDAGSLERRLAHIPALIRVAQTLAYAHSEGVVHRDIKPSNVVVGDYGETFVLDWGIAKVRGVASGSITGSGARAQESRHKPSRAAWWARPRTWRRSRRRDGSTRSTSAPTCLPSAACCSTS